MLDLYAELRRLIEALDEAGISYALAGGLAVSIYTTPRATEDIDLLIAPESLRGAVQTLQSLGFRTAGTPMPVAGGRLQIQRLTKIEGIDLLPVDLLVPAEPSLSRLLGERTRMPLEGRDMWVVDLSGPRGTRPRGRMTPRDVAPTLRKVSALRNLCARLPHLPTPLEERKLRRFQTLVGNPAQATDDDIEALVAGWRQWWREGNTTALFAMARKLPPELLARDRRLAGFSVAGGCVPAIPRGSALREGLAPSASEAGPAAP